MWKSLSVPIPPEEYFSLKYGPNWRVPKQQGFEADIIDSIPESIKLSQSSIFTKIRKFLFREKHLTQIKVLSSILQPIPNIEVTVVGIGKQNTDDHGNAVFNLSNEDYYAVDIGSGELREILYEEILKPGKITLMYRM